MIAYADSSVLVRAYMPDESGHAAAAHLLGGGEHDLFTGTWTRVELVAAFTRAARAKRMDVAATLALVAEHLGGDGLVTVVRVDQPAAEAEARRIVLDHGLRALDALHIAIANLSVRRLAQLAGLEPGFATRDAEQAAAAQALGYTLI